MGSQRIWRDQCNDMDEVWVPSDHNLRTFANAGVAPSKLHKVPETFDTELFDPGVRAPGRGGSSRIRVPVDVLVDRPQGLGHPPAGVVRGVRRGRRRDAAAQDRYRARARPARIVVARSIRSCAVNWTRPGKGPRIVVLDQPLEMTDVPRLYRAADAFVLASHGEGWGRPYMEAMAMGLPTIATRWSGNLEFMNDDNSYLVGYKLVDAPADSGLRGQQWAQPSLSDLRRAMRRVYEHRTEAAATGRERARTCWSAAAPSSWLRRCVSESRRRPTPAPRFPCEPGAVR